MATTNGDSDLGHHGSLTQTQLQELKLAQGVNKFLKVTDTVFGKNDKRENDPLNPVDKQQPAIVKPWFIDPEKGGDHTRHGKKKEGHDSGHGGGHDDGHDEHQNKCMAALIALPCVTVGHGHAHGAPSTIELVASGVVCATIYFFFMIVFSSMMFSDIAQNPKIEIPFTVANGVGIHLLATCIGCLVFSRVSGCKAVMAGTDLLPIIFAQEAMLSIQTSIEGSTTGKNHVAQVGSLPYPAPYPELYPACPALLANIAPSTIFQHCVQTLCPRHNCTQLCTRQ